MDRSRFTLVFITLLFPLALLAQPQVEWVWTDADTTRSYSSIGFDVTLDNGVALTSDYDMLTVRLDSLGQEVWRNDNTGGTSIARLNDGSFILPYNSGLYQIDSSGSFVDSIVLWYQGFQFLLRTRNSIMLSFAYSDCTWRNGECVPFDHSGTYRFDLFGNFIDIQSTEYRESGDGIILVSDFCETLDDLAFQADQQLTSTDWTWFRQLYAGVHCDHYYEPDNPCITVIAPHLAADNSGRLSQAALLRGYDDCDLTTPRVDVSYSDAGCNLVNTLTVLHPQDSVRSIVGFEPTSDGGYILVVNKGSWVGSRIELIRMDASMAVQWESEIASDLTYTGDAIVLGHDGRLSILGRITDENEVSHMRVTRLAPMDVLTSVEHPELSDNFALHPNYPNPFNPSTEISFDMPYGAPATLKVYDILGREVATLADGMLEAGTHQVMFDGTGLASGVYIYRLESNNFAQSKKMVLLK